VKPSRLLFRFRRICSKNLKIARREEKYYCMRYLTSAKPDGMFAVIAPPKSCVFVNDVAILEAIDRRSLICVQGDCEPAHDFMGFWTSKELIFRARQRRHPPRLLHSLLPTSPMKTSELGATWANIGLPGNHIETVSGKIQRK